LVKVHQAAAALVHAVWAVAVDRAAQMVIVVLLVQADLVENMVGAKGRIAQ
jgi:hypothetical protein